MGRTGCRKALDERVMPATALPYVDGHMSIEEPNEKQPDVKQLYVKKPQVKQK